MSAWWIRSIYRNALNISCRFVGKLPEAPGFAVRVGTALGSSTTTRHVIEPKRRMSAWRGLTAGQGQQF